MLSTKYKPGTQVRLIREGYSGSVMPTGEGAAKYPEAVLSSYHQVIIRWNHNGFIGYADENLLVEIKSRNLPEWW